MYSNTSACYDELRFLISCTYFIYILCLHILYMLYFLFCFWYILYCCGPHRLTSSSIHQWAPGFGYDLCVSRENGNTCFKRRWQPLVPAQFCSTTIRWELQKNVGVSSVRRGHANLLCIVPILTDDPRRLGYIYIS